MAEGHLPRETLQRAPSDSERNTSMRDQRMESATPPEQAIPPPGVNGDKSKTFIHVKSIFENPSCNTETGPSHRDAEPAFTPPKSGEPYCKAGFQDGRTEVKKQLEDRLLDVSDGLCQHPKENKHDRANCAHGAESDQTTPVHQQLQSEGKPQYPILLQTEGRSEGGCIGEPLQMAVTAEQTPPQPPTIHPQTPQFEQRQEASPQVPTVLHQPCPQSQRNSDSEAENGTSHISIGIDQLDLPPNYTVSCTGGSRNYQTKKGPPPQDNESQDPAGTDKNSSQCASNSPAAQTSSILEEPKAMSAIKENRTSPHCLSQPERGETEPDYQEQDSSSELSQQADITPRSTDSTVGCLESEESSSGQPGSMDSREGLHESEQKSSSQLSGDAALEPVPPSLRQPDAWLLPQGGCIGERLQMAVTADQITPQVPGPIPPGHHRSSPPEHSRQQPHEPRGASELSIHSTQDHVQLAERHSPERAPQLLFDCIRLRRPRHTPLPRGNHRMPLAAFTVTLSLGAMDMQDTQDLPPDTEGDLNLHRRDLHTRILGASGLPHHLQESDRESTRLPSNLQHILEDDLMRQLMAFLRETRGEHDMPALCVVCETRAVEVFVLPCCHCVLCRVCILTRANCPLHTCNHCIHFYWQFRR
ncbi:hypothetical protein ACOMHN_063273 [Nucella lapillus]